MTPLLAVSRSILSLFVHRAEAHSVQPSFRGKKKMNPKLLCKVGAIHSLPFVLGH